MQAKITDPEFPSTGICEWIWVKLREEDDDEYIRELLIFWVFCDDKVKHGDRETFV